MEQNIPFSARGFTVWGVCVCFYLYEFLLRTVVGTFQHPIMYAMDLSAFKFSLISSTAFLFVYGVMQIPVGLLVDRIGLKYSLMTGIGLCVLALAGFASSTQFYLAIFFRIMMGMGASFGFVCLMVSVFDWMPRSRIALLVGVSQFIGTMGPMLSAGPLEGLAQNPDMNWRMIFWGLSVAGALLFVCALLFVDNNHGTVGVFTLLRRPERMSRNLKSMLMRKVPWLLALFVASTFFMLEYLSENSGRHFIVLKGHTPQFAASLLTIGWLGCALGCPVLGLFSDLYARRKSFMLGTAFLCLLALVAIIFASQKWILILAFFTLGIGASGQSIGYAMMSEFCKPTQLALGAGLNTAMLTIFASVNAPVIGWILDNRAVGGEIGHSDYAFAFICMAVVIALFSIVPLWFIRETFAKSKVGLTYLKPRASDV